MLIEETVSLLVMGEQKVEQNVKALTGSCEHQIESLASKDISLVTRGTEIATRRGEVKVETLRVGDEIVSRDRGLSPVRWIGKLSAVECPIKVPAGALGRNVPLRDCWLAPNTRIWMRSFAFEAAFTSREVMVPVKDLIGWRGIMEDISHSPSTEYFLALCDVPQIITADGMQVEMRHAGADMPLFEAVDSDEMTAFLPSAPEFSSVTSNRRRRLSRSDARLLVEIQKRA
ncbi:Hint domain-containing protein [Shimia sp. R10_1]|uniref:Hint domain-containing protein n=1 Tax=Shimia sp. R10_1 TaxID=2821095 RepID=UPI001ADB47BB|nr:Hint domain-containing protein [Shimia sp. R10_1]MBO9473710.1 Hint domain-containing protein [Shimia sp. R10_1]